MTDAAAETPAEEVEPLSWELNQEQEWRLEQLVVAGYPPELALRIAVEPSVDLHRACDVVRGGCDPELAAALLL